MKVSDLAKELGITSKEVVEKAVAMGIEVKAAQSNLTDIDATALKNSILAKKKKDAETKIVKVKSKKTDQKADDEPKVTVKAAKISEAPEVKVKKSKPQTPQASSKNESTITKKAPIGKPVPKSGSGKAPIGKPVPKKAALAKKAEEEEKKLEAAKKEAAVKSAEKKETAVSEEKSETAVKPEKKKAFGNLFG